MLETEFLGLGYKGGGHLHIGGDDLGLGRVSVGPFVKKKKKGPKKWGLSLNPWGRTVHVSCWET